MTVTHVGPRDQTRAFHEQALERVAAIPGVRHVAFAWGVPLTGNSWPAEIEVAGRAAASSAIVDRISLPLRAVTEDYFAVMSMRLVDGPPVPADRQRGGAARSASSTAAFVRQHLGDGVAVGRQLRFPGNDKPTHDRRRASTTRAPSGCASARNPSCTSRSARTARSPSTWSSAPPAIRWRWRRRSAPRCARIQPTVGGRARHDDGRDPPRIDRGADLRAAPARPASRSSRRCWPPSGSTACCRSRWGRGRRSWPCARRSGRAGTR